MIEEFPDVFGLCDECKLPCTGSCDGGGCPVGTMSELHLMRILGNGRSGAGYALFHEIVKGLDRARRLHPVFAEGKWQGLGRISAEVGELVRAVDKGEGEDREIDEAFDSVAVLIRFILGEHKLGRRV